MSVKMLIVEDDIHALEAMNTYFKGLGYHVCSAGNAEDAIRLSDSFHPDILIADWMLAGELDGVALSRHLLHHNPTISVILITAHSRRAIMGASADLPVAAIVEKPLSLRKLGSLVECTLIS